MKLLFVGDVALGDHPKAMGFGFFSVYKNGIPERMAKMLFPSSFHADLIFGNLEYGLADEEIHGHSIQDVCCKGINKFVPFLSDAGFSVLNVANNHQYQHGRKHFINTMKNLKSSGIRVCGTPEDFIEENTIKQNGYNIAFLGWSDRPRQGFSETPLYNEFSENTSYDEIEAMKSIANIVCVSIHWGEEFVGVPSKREIAIARKMIGHGASIVIGHHPHVLREIELYRGGIIAYSLGNFICDMVWNKSTRESGCLCIEIDGGRLVDYAFHPASIGDDYFPHYLASDESTKFLEYKQKQYQMLYKTLNRVSYNDLSHRKRKRHQILTLLFMLKNMHRYRAKDLYEIYFQAIKNRISFSKGKQ